MKLIYCGLVNRGWMAEHLDMFSQNLLVGKNAVGKSTVIRALSNSASLLSQRRLLDDQDALACASVLTQSKRCLCHMQ